MEEIKKMLTDQKEFAEKKLVEIGHKEFLLKLERAQYNKVLKSAEKQLSEINDGKAESKA